MKLVQKTAKSLERWVCGAGMAAEAPLKTALTGLELLLARSQVWQETAAKHVSLAPQLERLAALALRWRRLQLAAWRSLIRTLAARHAAGARSSPLGHPDMLKYMNAEGLIYTGSLNLLSSTSLVLDLTCANMPD